MVTELKNDGIIDIDSKIIDSGSFKKCLTTCTEVSAFWPQKNKQNKTKYTVKLELFKEK